MQLDQRVAGLAEPLRHRRRPARQRVGAGARRLLLLHLRGDDRLPRGRYIVRAPLQVALAQPDDGLELVDLVAHHSNPLRMARVIGKDAVS